MNISLTYTGVQRLGLSEQTLVSFAREFILGMSERARILGDTGSSAPDTWELGYTDDARRIDLLLMLYANTPEHLAALKATQLQYLEESRGGVAELPGPQPPPPMTFSDSDASPRERRARAASEWCAQPRRSQRSWPRAATRMC